MNFRKLSVIGAVVLLGIVVAACTVSYEMAFPDAAVSAAMPMPISGPSTLEQVMERGHIICIGNATAPGFGYAGEDGSFSGFDIDFCKALAAAIFGDPEAYAIRLAITPAERFSVLTAGEADVLIRNTTITMARDTDLDSDFAPIIFYDGQGIMVRAADGITSLEDLAGGRVCVAMGTTTELNLADVMAAHGIEYEPVVFEGVDESVSAYETGRCDAFTTDKSGLTGRRAMLADPLAHIILDEALSKEPLGPIVRHGDNQWADIVRWVVYATFLAEELGVSSTNVDSMMESSNPNIRRLLGVDGGFGTKIGLDNAWAYNVISMVGNYAEIYDRNLGPDTDFYIPRGLNSSWIDGGLLYSPPIR